MVLVETDRKDAFVIAERIRRRIHDAGFEAAGRRLTVSIGVATFPEDASRREDLIDKADWAMYMAKRRGRDRVLPFAPE